jgi:MoaA/NifB/PqqE/SkfB family radical SAM enzyme
MVAILQQWRELWADRVLWPKLDHVQVEITSACGNGCVYCPNAVFRRAGQWPMESMPLDLFRCILPDLARSLHPDPWRQPLLHLQGWGEPLLHPDFLAMVQLAKQAGCRVGTTTCGHAVDRALAERLVDSGLDVLAFSVAGTDAASDGIRRGTSIEAVFAALAAVAEAKRAAGSAHPLISVAYMLLASQWAAAEAIPETFAGRGVEAVIISTLHYPPTPELSRESVLPTDEPEYEALAARLAAIVGRGRERGLAIAAHLPTPPPHRGLCKDEAQHLSLVVRPDGTVVPCILARLSVPSHPRLDVEQFVFGDLKRQSLREIWRGEAYIAFRRSFWDARPPGRCRECQRLGAGFVAERGGEAA